MFVIIRRFRVAGVALITGGVTVLEHHVGCRAIAENNAAPHVMRVVVTDESIVSGVQVIERESIIVRAARSLVIITVAINLDVRKDVADTADLDAWRARSL